MVPVEPPFWLGVGCDTHDDLSVKAFRLRMASVAGLIKSPYLLPAFNICVNPLTAVESPVEKQQGFRSGTVLKGWQSRRLSSLNVTSGPG